MLRNYILGLEELALLGACVGPHKHKHVTTVVLGAFEENETASRVMPGPLHTRCLWRGRVLRRWPLSRCVTLLQVSLFGKNNSKDL